VAGAGLAHQVKLLAPGCTPPGACCRFDGLSGSTSDGKPRVEVPPEVLQSIKKNGVSLWLCFCPGCLLVLFFKGDVARLCCPWTE
jgi:hypothetical protein